ncbi:MAG: hypothetical protein HOV86_05505 [Thermoactinospora sp.]|nr:hypothetical protein [Thermoactinospora sp.]
MLFEKRLREGVRDGSITLAFRRWRRCQVRPGGRYRMGEGLIAEVTAVGVAGEVDDDDARRAGYGTRDELLADLRNGEGARARRGGRRPTEDEGELYRIELRLAAEHDPRDELAADTAIDLPALAARLERMGPWTVPALELIAANPGVRAADLAPRLDQETAAFKLNVRKLKNLGLTISLETGYRISPRGSAFLAARRT